MNNRRPLSIEDSGELCRLVQAALTARNSAWAAEDALMNWIRDHTDHSDRAGAKVANGHPVTLTRAALAKPDRLVGAIMQTSAAIATGALPPKPSAEAIRHYLHVAPALAREVREAIRRLSVPE